MPVLACTSSYWQLMYTVKAEDTSTKKEISSKKNALSKKETPSKNNTSLEKDKPNSAQGSGKRVMTKTKHLHGQKILGERAHDNLRGYFTRSVRKWFREGRKLKEEGRVRDFCRAHDIMSQKAEEYMCLMGMGYTLNVSGARTKEVNGIYKAVGVMNGAVKFKRKEGKKIYLVCQAKVKKTGLIKWFICRSDRYGIDNDIDFYNVDCADPLPPSKGWGTIYGDLPTPTIQIQITRPYKIQAILQTKHFEQAYMIEMFHTRPDFLFNRFPDMQQVCAKANLTLCIERLRRRGKAFARLVSFYPRSFVLDSSEAITEFKAAFDSSKTYILKPDGGLQGIGITLVQDYKQVEDALRKNKELERKWEIERNNPELARDRVEKVKQAREKNELPENRHLGHLVAQEYISRPALIHRTKFDMRVYVLLRSLNPLRAHIMKEGLARFCTSPYVPPNKDNIKNAYMHLTNYHLNVTNDTFQEPTHNDGKAVVDAGESCASKRSISIALQQLKMDPNNFWKQIEEMVSVTLISLRPQLKQRYESLLLSRLEAAKTRKNKSNSRPPDQKSADSTDHRVASGLDEKIGEWDRCFQILGFDVILDEKGKAYLLEINDHPSLRSPTPLDKVIKAGVMRETLKIMDPDTRGIKHRKINACEDMTFKPPPQDAKNTKASQQEVKKGESTGGETLNGSNNAAVKVGRMNMKYLTILPETTYKGLVER